VDDIPYVVNDVVFSISCATLCSECHECHDVPSVVDDIVPCGMNAMMFRLSWETLFHVA